MNVPVVDVDVGGLDEEVWEGIQRLLDDYAGIRPEDDVVIAYTPEARESAAWVALACEDRGLLPALVHMAPLRDPGFRERLSAYIPDRRSKAGKCVLLMFERETMSHNVAVKLLLRKYDPEQYTVVRAINSGRDLFVTGLRTPPETLSALNTTLLERCRSARRLYIETENGTRLSATLNNAKYQYKSSRGIRQPGKFMVIPPGEVATFAETISGTLVADFALNVNVRLDKDVRLQHCPVIVTVADGKCVNFECSNPEIHQFLEKSFRRKNAIYVGELGFGTNPAVVKAVPENSHLNERIPGVHLGFGQHNQTDEIAGYSCDIHIDLCAKGGLIWFDDDPRPLNLEKLTPSEKPHPILISGEDVFSDDAEDDCCGLIT